MKVLRLDLMAFGPFAGTSLDFADGAAGIHIVYGPNEAGKSTALRALRQLLYGIPERSADAFRHPFPKMRIGGLLQASDGRTLEIVRRKGRTGTLRLPDDQGIVPEAELQRFTGGADADVFATMFGIGYDDLVAGGRAVVEGGGDLGRLLFSAGSGSASLGKLLDELHAEADALFRPAGQKQQVNEAASRVKQLRTELAAAQLMGAEWAEHERKLGTALHAKTETEGRLAAAQKRQHRLQRIAQARPLIAARRETLAALETVASAVLLPEGFAERRVQAVTRLRAAESERDQAQADVRRLRAAYGELAEPDRILAYAERIEEAHQDLGSQRKAARDCIGLETRRSTLRTEARQLLRALRGDLTLEECDRLRVRKTDALRIQELGGEYERIVGRIDSTRGRMPELGRNAAVVEAALAAMPPPRPVSDLKLGLSDIESALSAERQQAALRSEAERLRTECCDALAALGLHLPDPRDMLRLPVPSEETVRLFEDRLARLDQSIAAAMKTLQDLEGRLADTARRLDEARLEQEVPTEADLLSARAERDAEWRLIRTGRERGDAAPSEGGGDRLADRFEEALRRTDHLADRLRREADRVASKARLLADRSALEAQREALGRDRARLEQEREAAEAQWADRWQGIPVTPGSPREMRRWLSEFALVASKASHALDRERQADLLQSEVKKAAAALSEALAAIGDPRGGALSDLVPRARMIVAHEDQAAQRRSELDRERLRLEAEARAAESTLRSDEADLRRWQEEWAAAVEPLGIGREARPGEAAAVMDDLKRLFDQLKEAEVLQQRLEGIRRDAEAFGQGVRLLVEAVAEDLVGAPADEAALELQRRLTGARETHSRRAALSRQIAEADDRSRRALAAIAREQAALNDMCLEAGCTAAADLPDAERRSEHRRRLEARAANENERLLALSGGASLAEFIQEVEAVDPDGIDGEIGALAEEIRDLAARRSQLDQEIGGERAQLERMDGGDRAARVAEDIQSVLAGLERTVGRYARVKIAARVLETAIERFRERSQGPILRRACELFRRLTCGSFEGVRAEVGGAGGRPVIIGVRSGRDTVPVEGMSDGTADQLFLALRLSALEHYLDGTVEPLPFVVDDILIKFDNERAAAALEALSELAARTQVIFFTHHRHLLDVASAALAPTSVRVHRLTAA